MPKSSDTLDPPLSSADLKALQQACAPPGQLSFPPAEIIRKLRQHGYVEVVIGGIQAVQKGIERLLRERVGQRLPESGRHVGP